MTTTYTYEESAEYGQTILDIIGTANLLANPDQPMTKTEIKSICNEIRKKAKKIQNVLDRKSDDPMEFFGLDNVKEGRE